MKLLIFFCFFNDYIRPGMPPHMPAYKTLLWCGLKIMDVVYSMLLFLLLTNNCWKKLLIYEVKLNRWHPAFCTVVCTLCVFLYRCAIRQFISLMSYMQGWLAVVMHIGEQSVIGAVTFELELWCDRWMCCCQTFPFYVIVSGLMFRVGETRRCSTPFIYRHTV